MLSRYYTPINVPNPDRGFRPVRPANRCSATLALAVVGIVAYAGALNARDAVTPPKSDGPVIVSVGLHVVDISHISEVDNTYRAEFDIVGVWHDARLGFDEASEGSDRRVFVGPASERLRTQIWNVQALAANAVGGMEMLNQKITTFADGRLMIEVRVAATMRADLDYRRFPFDEQTFPVHLESFAWNRDVVQFEALPDATGFDANFRMPEWTVRDVASVVSEVERPRDSVPYSRLTYLIHVDRMSAFYVWKVFLPLFVIVGISWVVFWMGREALGRRAGVSVTGILTVIAYQFLVSEALPRVSYLTVLDRLLLLSLVAIASTLFVSIIVEAIDSRGRDASSIDRRSRLLFPLVYYSVVALIVFL